MRAFSHVAVKLCQLSIPVKQLLCQAGVFSLEAEQLHLKIFHLLLLAVSANNMQQDVRKQAKKRVCVRDMAVQCLGRSL